MELQAYWRVLRRGWRLVLAVTLLTAAASLGVTFLGGSGYKLETQLLINPIVDPSKLPANLQYPPEYYQELVAEYILDDFIEVLKTRAFAQRISDSIQGSVDADTIMRALTAERVHRTLKINIAASTAAQGTRIGNAIDALVLKEAPSYFTDANANVVTVKVIEPPEIVQRPTASRQTAFWLMRTLVGVVAGIALVFAVHALDNRIHDRADVERELGLEVLAEIPSPRPRRRGDKGGPSPLSRPLPAPDVPASHADSAASPDDARRAGETVGARGRQGE